MITAVLVTVYFAGLVGTMSRLAWRDTHQKEA
jgi:hypothetical protein